MSKSNGKSNDESNGTNINRSNTGYDVVQRVTTDLVQGQESWKKQNIVGVGLINSPTPKISILMLTKVVPPELEAYMSGIGLPAETRVTGPFEFTSAGSGAPILSEGVSGFGTMTAV